MAIDVPHEIGGAEEKILTRSLHQEPTAPLP
jgi:hypothetical protein